MSPSVLLVLQIVFIIISLPTSAEEQECYITFDQLPLSPSIIMCKGVAAVKYNVPRLAVVANTPQPQLARLMPQADHISY